MSVALPLPQPVRPPSPEEEHVAHLFRSLRAIISRDDLDDETVRLLCRHGQKWKPKQKSAPLLKLNEPAAHLLIILAGQVSLEKHGCVLRFLSRGEVFGLESVSQALPLGTYLPLDTVGFILVPWPKIQNLAPGYPRLLPWIIKLQERQAMALADLPLYTVRGQVDERLARLFLELNRRFGLADERGRFLPLRLTRARLAKMLGGIRTETVIRFMTAWEEQGKITTLPEGFVLHDLLFFQSLADCS